MENLLRNIGNIFAPLNWDDAAIKRGVLVVAIFIEGIVITAEIFFLLGSFGKNIFWYFMACGLVVVIVAINWIAKSGKITTLKTIAKAGLVLALVMMPVCTIWPSASVKNATTLATTPTIMPTAANWWAEEIPVEKNGQIIIGEVKANDQLRSWSANGHVILRDGHSPNQIGGGVDMITTFEEFDGSKAIKLSGNGKTDTVVRYKITRR